MVIKIAYRILTGSVSVSALRTLETRILVGGEKTREEIGLGRKPGSWELGIGNWVWIYEIWKVGILGVLDAALESMCRRGGFLWLGSRRALRLHFLYSHRLMGSCFDEDAAWVGCTMISCDEFA